MMWNMIVREKIPDIFLCLLTENDYSYNKSMTQISKETDITYSYIFKIIPEFQLNGFLNIEKSGRTSLVTLTKTGRELAILLRKLSEMLRK